MKRLAAALLSALLLCGCSVPQPPKPTLPPSPYTAQDYYFEDGLLACSAGQTVIGIDVSSHQKDIDWQQVASAGVKFAMIRLGNRGYESGILHEDAYAKANLAGAKAAGIKVGAYFFSQAITVEEAQEKAEFDAVVTEVSGRGVNNGGSSKFAVKLELEKAENIRKSLESR